MRALIGELIEDKLIELMRDPDDGLEVRSSVRQRLREQQQAVRADVRRQGTQIGELSAAPDPGID